MDSKVLSIIIKATDEASKVFSSIGDNATEAGKHLTKTLSLPIAAVGIASLKMAGDFEQSLNILQSVTGATDVQMTQLRSTARALGNDVSLPGISAKDAASAMSDLAKAGLSVNDVMAASKGVLSLAKAGQLDVGDAAMTTARALNAFQLSGDQANKIADLLSASANASTASVQDMALGLQMAGAQSHQMGISLQDTVTALAMFSNAGINGSDAGTSLKQMFIQLATPTKQASGLMRSLGLDFFDAKGNFIGLSNMSEMLKSKLSNLTVEQKNSALATIFGSDATRVASILAQGGAEKFDAMSKAVNKQGAAADLAAAQNKGFNGAMDNLRSTAETALIDIGSDLLPALTRALKSLSSTVTRVTDWFNSLSSSQQDMIFKTVAIVAAVGPALLIFGKLASTISTVVGATTTLSAGLRGLMGITTIARGAAGIGGLATAAEGSTVAMGGMAAALTGPVGIALIGTALIAGGAYLAYRKFNDAGKDLGATTTGLFAPVSFLSLAQGDLRLKTDAVAAATARHKAAIDAIAPSQDLAKQRASAVATAQQSVKDAFDRYGASSPQYINAVQTLRDKEDALNLQLLNNWSNNVNVKRTSDELAGARTNLARSTSELNRLQGILNNGLDSGVNIVAKFGPVAVNQIGGLMKLQGAISSVVTSFSGISIAAANQTTIAGKYLQGLSSTINKVQGQSSTLNKSLQTSNSIGLQGGSASLQGGHNAKGTTNWKGGITWVGEEGPELVNLPAGSQVMPHAESMARTSGSTFNMYGSINLGDASAVDSFFDRLNAQKELAAYGAGV